MSTKIDAVALGQNIRRRRLALGLSQADLTGDMVGAAYLSRIETGDRIPSRKVLQHFAMKLETTPEVLIAGAAAGPDAAAVDAAAAASQWLKDPRDTEAYVRMLAAVERWELNVEAGTRRFNIDESARLAREAHAGQVDKQGRDYFAAHLEPIARSLRSFGAAAVMAGYLHDVLEDTDHTPATLAARGVPAEVIEAVISVTKVDDEPYPQLIERAAAHPVGRLVKLADNTLNLASNPGLAETDPEGAQRMLEEKYLPARERLLDGLPDDEGVLARITADLGI